MGSLGNLQGPAAVTASTTDVLRSNKNGIPNEHIEADGPTRLQDGPRRDRLEAQDLELPLGPLAAVAQVEEPGVRGGAGGGERLGPSLEIG
jgi:hypothetical protein